MTNADVDRLIVQARAKGRDLTEYKAAVVLGAREILQEQPENANARQVCEHFSEFMATGRWPRSFAEFFLPMERFLTVEEKLGRVA